MSNLIDTPAYYSGCVTNPDNVRLDEYKSSLAPTESLMIPDNYFLNCPNTIDGRTFTDYKTGTQRNEYIKYINNIRRDDEYRVFLQENSRQIMDREWAYNKIVNKCQANACIHNNFPLRSLPQDHAAQMKAYNNRYVNGTPRPRTVPSGDGYKQSSGKNCQKCSDYRLNPDSSK